MKLKNKVVLASQSPRRRELLGLLADDFEICVSDADETLADGIAPSAAVEQLALRKARAVACGMPEAIVIGADTVVAIDGMILGKPADEKDARAMLSRLSGRVHQVYTGVAVCLGAEEHVFHCCTSVEFCALTAEEIKWYISTGEPFDKAGAYGIQQYGARFVKGVVGDYFNVMGLPVNSLYHVLADIAK